MKTPLEAVLQAMVTGAWANESDGDVQSPMGAFARVTVENAELSEVQGAFNDVMRMYGLNEDDAHMLIGHFLVQELSSGAVDVVRYDNPIELTREFQRLQDAYSLWLESE